MISWMYFPKNQPLDAVSQQVVKAFQNIASEVDSETHHYYQFLKDFFEACTMVGVEKLCIAVRNTYKASNDFEKVCRFFEAMYASGRLGVPLSGLLIIGY